MSLSRIRFTIPLLTLPLIISACTSTPQGTSTPTYGPALEDPVYPAKLVELVESEIVWMGLPADEPCYPAAPNPILKICLKNQGEQAASPESAAVALPALLAQEALEQVMGSLPGGDWLPPFPLTLTGIPDVIGDSEGIIIINNNPGPDSPAAGIIIVNSIPAESNVASVFIVLQNMPTPLTAEGIIIINNKEGTQALTGGITLQFEILAASPAGDGPSLGFAQVAADITQDHYNVNAQITSTPEFTPLENITKMEGGIKWGGLVAIIEDNYGTSSPLVEQIEFIIEDNIPNPADSQAAIVWGGLPADAAGIIIINNFPSPNSETEGIIIVNSKDISQVMGIIVEDKPGDDQGSEGIIIVNNMPAGSPVQGVDWESLAWSGMPDSEQGSEGILIIDSKPALGSNNQWTGLPIGFGLPEGMTPMMGQGGFGPWPMAFGLISLQEMGLAIPGGETNCLEIPLTSLIPLLPGYGGGTFHIDSFFDVYTELTVGIPEAGEGDLLVTRIDPPTHTICTPTPGAEPYTPVLSSPTPTPGVEPFTPVLSSPTPTPTLRTGLPTKTPASRLPTATPTPSRGN